MEWIASCRILVSSDSLGLHIALALGIPVVGLFGPTSAKEVHFYGKSSVLQKESMSQILPQEVFEEISKIIEEH
jgi:heptosyltransferase-2